MMGFISQECSVCSEEVYVPQVSQNTCWRCLISATALGIISSDQKVRWDSGRHFSMSVIQQAFL